MTRYPSDIAFTPAVKAIQTTEGSRQSYANMEQRGSWQTTVTENLEEFLADLDMLYLGTANAEGQPYIQYRGGSPGFLKKIDDRTLGFADFRGNRQFITVGNLSENSKAFIFLIDYVNRRRVKIWGTAEVVEGNSELKQELANADYQAQIERVILFHVEAWDINCPQHIHKRFPQSMVTGVVADLQQKIRELEDQIQELQTESQT